MTKEKKPRKPRKKKEKAPEPVVIPIEVFSGTQVYTVSGVEKTFPVSKGWFTPYEKIPKDYKSNINDWVSAWSSCFFSTKPWTDLRMLPREDTNPGNVHSEKVMDMIHVITGCRDIYAEHKSALAGYVLGSFFSHVWFEGDDPPVDLT